jgi:Ankyrin repeats (3 copies)/Ankyrin repeat
VCDTSPDGATLIFSAVIHKRLKAACYLVSAGADVRAKTLRGYTVVQLAAQYDAVRILRWLVVTQKLDPCEAAAADGWLPLHCACCFDQIAAVEYLLSLQQAAAMLSAESNEGCTALHCAAESEHDDIVKFLLRKGAAVDARSHSGVTPLMQAQLVSTTGVLVNAHADVNAVDDDASQYCITVLSKEQLSVSTSCYCSAVQYRQLLIRMAQHQHILQAWLVTLLMKHCCQKLLICTARHRLLSLLRTLLRSRGHLAAE